MKNTFSIIMAMTACVASAGATVRFVNVNSANPTPPYTNWATAANVIQDAIDAASAGDEIVVTNGVYQTGAHDVVGIRSNRVAVTKALTLRSVNGPDATVIRGHRGENSPFAHDAVRCVYLTNNAVLVGFTLTNGGVPIVPSGSEGRFLNGGGVLCESASSVVSNCVLIGNAARGSAYSGTLNNCAVIGNSGGGALGSTLNNCLVTSNSNYGFGGGAHESTLSNCTLVANTAIYGGGAAFSMLVDCLITNNFATDGGGAWNCDLRRCVLVGNRATLGGGVWGDPCAGIWQENGTGCPPPEACPWDECFPVPGLSIDCTIAGNIAAVGGGAYGGRLHDCTLAGNIAQADGSELGGSGGGVANASLSGVLVEGNQANHGGGAFASVLNNCVLNGNLAAFYGGGSKDSLLVNCVLSDNSAQQEGGGTYGGTLNNCIVERNMALMRGGGALSCFWGVSPPVCPSVAYINNSIIYDNEAPQGANHFGFTGSGSNFFGGSFNYSCTTPLPTNGIGNIANAPLFMDAAAGNFRLQSNSPCINAGRNSYSPSGSDLDGNSRIVGGTVDMGAYEFKSPQSTISYGWLQQFSLPTDGSADFTDSDGDGHNNWQEWLARTDPTNSSSALRLLTPLISTNGLLVRWQSVSGLNYCLERTRNLGFQPAFTPVVSNLAGEAGITVYTDTNLVGFGPFLYRVGVRD